ncbi:hypothetical protein [Spirosoma endophyticum]|uniref:Uncharacterized protein n=1 Tax=Spirosoma endophyticum TaxID=662367 RepID=A0A1I2GJN1_9BACT|nr:hypothetical protein [Spirosoma endophyticum]SFF17712.1 hypothetical protein SAMN05216167_13324 [Spirosoma endophyticum]
MRVLRLTLMVMNTIDLLAQSTLPGIPTREVTLSDPLVRAELRNNLSASQREVYIGSIVKQAGKITYTLSQVGYTSELKARPCSLYTIVNHTLIFLRTGVDELIEQDAFFLNVVLPLTKGRLINDLLPNGRKNPDVLPYGGYDPVDITITLEKGKVSISKEAQP